MSEEMDARIRKRRRLIVLIAVILLLIFFVVRMMIEPLTLRIEQTHLTSSDLPKDIGQIKILFLSDLHYGYFFSAGRLADLVSKANALKPDLILLGGDYGTDQKSAITFFENFPDFHSRYGIYAVLGDRDMDGDDLTALRRAIMKAGVTSLQNETAVIRIGNSSVTVAGVGDPTTGNADVLGVAEKVQSTDYVIFLCHSPEAIEMGLRADSRDGQRRWFDLGLFGHTHGGQISFLDQILGISNVDPRYLSGWNQENRIDMLITNGVGVSKIPFRFRVPPQIHLITVSR